MAKNIRKLEEALADIITTLSDMGSKHNITGELMAETDQKQKDLEAFPVDSKDPMVVATRQEVEDFKKRLKAYEADIAPLEKQEIELELEMFEISDLPFGNPDDLLPIIDLITDSSKQRLAQAEILAE